MSIFDAIGIAGSGLTVYRKWLDAVSDNIANINTVNPYERGRLPERLRRRPGGRLRHRRGRRRVAGAVFGSARGPARLRARQPARRRRGLRPYPDIDLGDQMAQLMMAQRGYQANLAVVDRASDAYQAALQLGKG